MRFSGVLVVATLAAFAKGNYLPVVKDADIESRAPGVVCSFPGVPTCAFIIILVA